MGRTNPTYRDRLGRVANRWQAFRRGLRRRDKPHFDRLLAHARAHADAGGYLNPDDPTVAVWLSVALEQERRVAALEERVEELETALAAQGVVRVDGRPRRDAEGTPPLSTFD